MVVFSNILTSVKTYRFLKRKPIKVRLACVYDRKSGNLVGSRVNSIIATLEGDAVSEGNRLDIKMILLNSIGEEIKSGGALSLHQGGRVKVKVSGESFSGTGMKAYARSCFVTPDSNSTSMHSIWHRVDLIKD